MTEAKKFLTAQKFLAMRRLNLTSTAEYGYIPDNTLRQYVIRDEYIAKYGFAVPNRSALKAIALHAPILEIGAGSGYWSYELKKLGVDVVATDPALGRYRANGKSFFWKEPWLNVERLTAVDAIEKYTTHSLLVVWPDHHCDWPIKALRAYHGEYLFYVGEGDGGCTGNDAFHQYLEENFTCVNTIGIPQFYGIHDRLFCYRRKGKSNESQIC